LLQAKCTYPLIYRRHGGRILFVAVVDIFGWVQICLATPDTTNITTSHFLRFIDSLPMRPSVTLLLLHIACHCVCVSSFLQPRKSRELQANSRLAARGRWLAAAGSIFLASNSESGLTATTMSGISDTKNISSSGLSSESTDSKKSFEADPSKPRRESAWSVMLRGRGRQSLSPRITSVLYMVAAMSLHFGGYEFIRNAALALFTSTSAAVGGGFPSAAAFPLANALVSPCSVLMLLAYSQLLEQYGPRLALRTTTGASVVYILAASSVLSLCQRVLLQSSSVSGATYFFKYLARAVVGLTYLFQNSYQYLLYTQQWSFVGSVLTPDEGAVWFALITGFSSAVCSLVGVAIPFIVPRSGLVGLLALTSITLSGSLLCADHAYRIAQRHHFDPSKTTPKPSSSQKVDTSDEDRQPGEQALQKLNTTVCARVEQQPASPVSKVSPLTAPQSPTDTETAAGTNKQTNTLGTQIRDAMKLFQQVPTLRSLALEVLSYQSFNTILNVAFVRSLKAAYPSEDTQRAAFSARFYSGVNFGSMLCQFFLIPLMLRFMEPRRAWYFMPVLPLSLCVAQVALPLSESLFGFSSFRKSELSLLLWSAAFFLSKVTDYALRSVLVVMAYQPLVYQSRYKGKEIIGVLGSRLGKSGMSVLLSVLTLLGIPIDSLLSFLAAGAGMVWTGSSWDLARLLPTQAEAERIVSQRGGGYSKDEKKKL
jgi:TLC ATP/ADP transporter